MRLISTNVCTYLYYVYLSTYFKYWRLVIPLKASERETHPSGPIWLSQRLWIEIIDNYFTTTSVSHVHRNLWCNILLWPIATCMYNWAAACATNWVKKQAEVKEVTSLATLILSSCAAQCNHTATCKITKHEIYIAMVRLTHVGWHHFHVRFLIHSWWGYEYFLLAKMSAYTVHNCQ